MFIDNKKKTKIINIMLCIHIYINYQKRFSNKFKTLIINFNSKYFFFVFNNKSTILVFEFSNILVPQESEQKFILKDTFIILQCKV